jgi:hypothetical protein
MLISPGLELERSDGSPDLMGAVYAGKACRGQPRFVKESVAAGKRFEEALKASSSTSV